MEIGSRRETRHPWGNAATVYEQIGGDAVVRRLTDAFYDAVEADSPKLRAMLPASTRLSRLKLYEFLSGWMGGPRLYWERRGDPALRIRHSPFPIDSDAADQWSACMRRAIEICALEEPAATWLGDELARVASMLLNRPAEVTG
jgi:hemoglobin